MTSNVEQLPAMQATPRVVQPEALNHITVDEAAIASTMHELGISDSAISGTTIMLDPHSRFLNRGTHYPNKIGKIRFWSNHEIRHSPGDIIRLSTKMRGKDVPEDSMNRVLVHELVHRAQQDRHDENLTKGHSVIYGLAAAGLYAGERFTRNHKSKAARPIGALAAGFIGYQIGYWLAPHEKEARAIAGNQQRVGEVTTRAIRRQ